MVSACNSGAVDKLASTQITDNESGIGIESTTERVEQPKPLGNSITTGRIGNEKLIPELAGINAWFNTEPFTFEELLGKVVLVDFWTYTCVNCIRTLPFLRDWHEKYAVDGLVIVGVHTPEFEFEHIYENVETAIQQYDLEYPIVQDNSYATWRAFSNRYWPAKYLVDKDGYIRYTHFGEGAYEETELWIRTLLTETGTDLQQPAGRTLQQRGYDPAVYNRDAVTSLTRELYAGTDRNYAAMRFRDPPPYVRNLEFYDQPNIAIDYVDAGGHENHFIYLQGLWRNAEESLVHARTTEDNRDYIAIKFHATSVNVVMDSPDRNPASVVVTINNRSLKSSEAGIDIQWTDDGDSYVLVDSPRMYNIIEIAFFDGYELKLSPNEEGLQLFAFTFGGFKNE